MDKKNIRCFYVTVCLCGFLWLGGACTREGEADGGGKSAESAVSLVVRAMKSDFGNLRGEGKSLSRAPVEDGLETRFATGDSIGLFAVRDHAVINGMDNMKLVYGATDGQEHWTTLEGSTLYWYEGVEYIAYYPYKKGVSIDVSQSTDEIVASLRANSLLQPLADQADPDRYAAGDLMIAEGVLSDDVLSSGKILTLKFVHQFTLLVLNPLAYVDCFAPAGAGFTYRNKSKIPAVDEGVKKVTLNNVNACAMGDGSYRAIVVPASDSRMAGKYTTEDGLSSGMEKEVAFSGSETDFEAGTCYTLQVISPLPGIGSTERALAPGDFVFDDGGSIEVYPGNGFLQDGKILEYEKAVGMVITCSAERMTDEECRKKGWTHAYVMGLETIGKGTWGVKGVKESHLTAMTRYDKIDKNMNGYSETETMLADHDGESYTYAAFNKVKTYRASHSVSGDIRSPWFIPSVGQWFDLLVNICGRSPYDFSPNSDVGLEDHQWGTETLAILDAQLEKVGKPLGELESYRHIFWCSTEYNEQYSWILIWHIDDPDYNWKRIALKGYSKGSQYPIRLFFAF